MTNRKGHRRSATRRRPKRKPRFNIRKAMYSIKRDITKRIRFSFLHKPIDPAGVAEYMTTFLKRVALERLGNSNDFDIQVLSTPGEDGGVSVTAGNLQTLIMMSGQGRERIPTLKELEGLTEWSGEICKYLFVDGQACIMPYVAAERITVTCTLDPDTLKELLTKQ